MNNPILRRFRPTFVWGVLALVLVFTSSWVLQHVAVGLNLRVALALAPLVPAGLFIIALVRATRQFDELQQRIYLESVAIAFVITVLLTFVFAGLQRAGLYTAKWDDIGNTMMIVWLLAYLINVWRYQ